MCWCCEELDALSEDGGEVWEDGGGRVRELACWDGGEERLEEGCGVRRLEGGWDGGWHRYGVVR